MERIASQEGGGRGRRGLPTYVGCTGERETGETRKVRGDPGGKARVSGNVFYTFRSKMATNVIKMSSNGHSEMASDGR